MSVSHFLQQRKRLEKEINAKVDDVCKYINPNAGPAIENEEQKPTALELYNVTQRYLAFASHGLLDESKKCSTDSLDRFERMCRIISGTLKEESPKYSYIGMAINKDKNKARSFIEHLKKLLTILGR